MAVQPAESLPVTSFTNHLRYFYKFINQRIYDRSDVGVPVDTDNTVIVDNCEKAIMYLILISLVCGKKTIMLFTDVKT